MAKPFLKKEDTKYLFLPVETKAREFHGKLLLSCFAAEAGFQVILGEQIELRDNLHSLPYGIYLDKSIAPTKAGSFQKIHRMRNRLAAWCEEGLVYRDRDAYIRERISLKSFSKIDLFFAWGNVQANDLRIKIKEDTDKIIQTGNPRFDILRKPFRKIFDKEAETLRKKYGHFILINTNFSRFNHYSGNRDAVLAGLKRQGKILTREDEKFFWEWSNYLGVIYRGFKDILPVLSKSFPDYRIIIRPHPSENHGVYREASINLDNVNVEFRGSVIPWILASDVLIHNSCTTGLEAFLLERPVIAYCPATSDVFDSVLPNAVSVNTYTMEELIETIKKILLRGPGKEKPHVNPAASDFVKKYVTGISDAFAAERIVENLELLSKNFSEDQLNNSRPPFEMILNRLMDPVPHLKKLLKRFRIDLSRGKGYRSQKFPGLSIEEISETIELITEASNRFHHVRVKRLSGTDMCYRIYKDADILF